MAANGFADRVTIHSIMSTDLTPSDVGGVFDILVCEIVDDQVSWAWIGMEPNEGDLNAPPMMRPDETQCAPMRLDAPR